MFKFQSRKQLTASFVKADITKLIKDDKVKILELPVVHSNLMVTHSLLEFDDKIRHRHKKCATFFQASCCAATILLDDDGTKRLYRLGL